MFQFPGFAFVSYVFRNKSFNQPKPMPIRRSRGSTNSHRRKLEVGFPIRKYSDQSLFAAPQVLSQRTTSFIASQRQGIHRILLRHLIALIVDARSATGSTQRSNQETHPSQAACASRPKKAIDAGQRHSAEPPSHKRPVARPCPGAPRSSRSTQD